MAISKFMNIKNSKKNPKKQGKHLKNALEYIANPEKTENGLYLAGVNCVADPEGAYMQMANTKKALNTNGSRQAYHFVLSLPPGEGSADIMMELTKKFIDRYFKDEYEILYAVHNNTDKIHSHIIFNSVSFKTGKKYRYENGDWLRIINPLLNELCSEYGLPTLEMEDIIEEKKKDKRGRVTLKEDIDNAIEKAETYNEFLNIMLKDYRINYGKYLSMKNKENDKGSYIRVKSIGELYSEDILKLRIAMKQGYLKKYSYSYKRRIKYFRADYNFLKKVKYKKMNSYQKWVLKKYLRQKKMMKNSTMNMNTWKYRDEYKKIKDVQEEYIYIVSHGIKKISEVDTRLHDINQEKINIAVKRKRFNIEGKVYENILEKYKKLQSLERKYNIYLYTKDNDYKVSFDEYIQTKNEIKQLGFELKEIEGYLENIKEKKEEFKSKNYEIKSEENILKRLKMKSQCDNLFLLEDLKNSIDNIDINMYDNFELWSKSRIANAYSFEESFNHETSRDYSRENFYIICDRTCPKNYIRVHSKREIYNNEEYTKSYYEVFSEEKLVMNCDDGRFAGREKNYWYKLKQEMRSAGGMADDNIIFENEENFLKYLSLYNDSKNSKKKSINSLQEKINKEEIDKNEKGRDIKS